MNAITTRADRDADAGLLEDRVDRPIGGLGRHGCPNPSRRAEEDHSGACQETDPAEPQVKGSMKPIQKNSTSAPADSAKKTAGKKQSKAATVVLPFSALHISKWNRSFGVEPDEEYIEELARDIQHNGLIQPISIVPSTKGGDPDAILAGANRFWALKKVRGADSGLKEGEFTVRTDIADDDPRCLDISLSENGHRRQSSVIETARYVGRLLQEQKVDQKKLAPKLHLRREVVNRMSKLVKCFDQLPPAWQKDLSRSPSKEGGDIPAITLSHWVEVAAEIDEGEITPEVRGVLEKAADERLSTRELRKALRTPTEEVGTDREDSKPDSANESGAQPVTPPAQQAGDHRQLLEKALKAIEAAAESVNATLPDEAKNLRKAVGLVKGVLGRIGSDKSKAESHDTQKKVA